MRQEARNAAYLREEEEARLRQDLVEIRERLRQGEEERNDAVSQLGKIQGERRDLQAQLSNVAGELRVNQAAMQRLEADLLKLVVYRKPPHLLPLRHQWNGTWPILRLWPPPSRG